VFFLLFVDHILTRELPTIKSK